PYDAGLVAARTSKYITKPGKCLIALGCQCGKTRISPLPRYTISAQSGLSQHLQVAAGQRASPHPMRMAVFTGWEGFRNGRLQRTQAVFSFCSMLFSTAASNLWNASANNFTPSAVSLVVPSMIAKGINGRRRHSVYCVRPDQFLHVHDVSISRILRAGACPEHALGLRALGSQRLPSRSAEDLLVALVGKFSIGNRNLTLQTA